MPQNELEQALIKSVKVLDGTAVRRLLEAGANPDAQEILEKDPEYLLPDPSVIDLAVGSAAQYFIDHKKIPDQIEQIVRDLLDYGAKAKGTRYNQVLLVFAAINGLGPVVRLLVEYGADPNIPRSNGDLAIHYAVSRCDLQTVQALVTHGSEINGLDLYGRSPRYIALKEKKHEIAAYLRDVGGEVIPDPKDGPPFKQDAVFLE